jgi:hypothetical protein
VNDFADTSRPGDPDSTRQDALAERDALLNTGPFGGEPDREVAQRRSRLHKKARPAIVPACIAALFVGAVVTVAGRFEYLCTAELVIKGVPEQRGHLAHGEVRRFLWEKTSMLSGPPGAPARWSAANPSPGALHISLATPDRTAGLSALRWMVEAFLDDVRKRAERIRSTPGEAEAELESYFAGLKGRMADLQGHFENVTRSMPPEVAESEQVSLIQEWTALRDGFSEARTRLSAAVSDVARLENAPAPAGGLVLEAEREEAYRADRALQQDLKELAVTLAEMKSQVLAVWKKSTPMLERLKASQTELESGIEKQRTEVVATPQVVSTANAAAPANRHAVIVGTLLRPLEDYSALLTSFAFDWTAYFTDLQKTEMNARDPVILDVYPRALKRLRDFLFEASRHLSAIRDVVQRMGADPADDARLHLQLSEVLRLFEGLQHAHHQFEFAAGQLETPTNFRLDAPWHAARGLWRRSAERMERIDQALTATAVERARAFRLAELAAARNTIDQVRLQTDNMVDDLLRIQAGMVQSNEESEQFLRAMSELEASAARLKITETDLAQIESRLQELKQRRMQTAPTTDVRLVACRADGVPINLAERLRIGGIAFGLTLISLLLTQWWTFRRSN